MEDNSERGDREDDEAEETGEEDNVERIESGEKSEVKKANRQLIGKIYKKSSVNGVLECTKCDKQCATVKQIFNHYETVHLQKRYKCDVCNEAVYDHAEGLRTHKRKCRGKREQKFGCRLCWETFSLKRRISAHLSQIHKILEKQFPCEICGKIFRSPYTLKDHQDVVYNGKRFCCKFCGKPYFSRGSVYTHEKTCAKKEPVK